MSYRTAHPHCHIPSAVLRDLEQLSYTDCSWHYDAMPHWERGNIWVWVDYPEHLSECASRNWKRFCVCCYNAEVGRMEEPPLLRSNEWGAVYAYLRNAHSN